MTTELVTADTSAHENVRTDATGNKRKVYEPEIFEPDREARLMRIRMIAQLMDDAFFVPGTNYRIGWDSVIGLIPGIGDVASACVSGWIVYEAKQLGLPKWKLARMLANIGVDTTLGIVPFVGDAFDATFKANRKNAHIVLKHFGRHETV
ncbi:MAG: DUF4112 domain-containing protein [Planctomycetaceae bacterium]|nr:DUF4112 domain-containing protein [Planctomycetaceae bacterium]